MTQKWQLYTNVALSVCLLQTPGGAHQRPGHPQRHVAHLQDHARLCQVGYLPCLFVLYTSNYFHSFRASEK